MKETNGKSGTRVTLRDVANASGYSVNTISRALRNDSKLNKATRDKIKASARRLGYVQNMLASSLRSGTSHLVAVIVNDLRNQHFTIMLSKIDRALREAGYNMMVLCMQLNEDLGEQLIKTAISHQVDGILYFPYHDNPGHVEHMRNYNTPFVLVDRWIKGVTADSVRCDDTMGGYLAARHLIQLGHTRFLRLAGVLASSSELDRREGFYRALQEANLPAHSVRTIPWEASEAAIASNTYGELMAPLDYTAVFCFSDELAYHALNALESRGVQVPGDVSLISFDHISAGVPFLERITSVYADGQRDVATLAVDVLLKRIANPDIQTQNLILPVKIFDEGTTAPPRAWC